ncbi:MAG TPA: M1 family metallopeptidase [Thermoanaerobaculia bacterium]|nr:M1 family metallopeptidase [Thermoanaerobaculia bacterium]
MIRPVALMLLSAVPACAATPVSPPVVEYRIAVSLEPKEKMLEGTEHLVWRNPSGDAVSELRFHLYLNAFKNNRTTFMRESGGQLRGDEAGNKPGDWGWIDVTSMKIAGGADLTAAGEFIQPDGNDPSDQTVLRVPLPSPVPPHGEIALDVAFRAKLPKIFARTGFVRDYFLVGQWYPKIGVYEPAGMRHRARGGWNCHAFHANSEFYADFGNFDVTMTVPSRFVVGATGKRVAETRQGDRTAYRYRQDNVHDFAWTADPRFVVVDFPFDPARDVPPEVAAKAAKELGLTEKEIALKPVACRLLLQPNHGAARERYVRSAKQGLVFYGLWFGAYPYETLTVVDPPDDGGGSGGMEYPTFITGGEAEPVLTRWPFERVRGVEIVTIHEFGHQYWYGMAGSNEFEESWLDEGLNTDSEYRSMALFYGPRDMAQLPGGVGMTSYAFAHGVYTRLPNLDPIDSCAWCFASDSSYAANSYMKVGLFMAQLKNDLGADVFARAQRAYFQEWSFRHPDTTDFFDTFERVSGRDLSTYRKNVVDGRARLDWQVVSARSVRADADYGVFDTGGKKATYDDGVLVPSGGKSAPRREEQDRPKTYATRVLFGNTGDWPHGAKARMVFTDGTVVERTLPAEARWVRFRIAYGSRLAWAAVDPDRQNPWDWNRLNDSRVLDTGKGAARTLGVRAFVKYSAFVAYLDALWTQILWALA